MNLVNYSWSRDFTDFHVARGWSWDISPSKVAKARKAIDFLSSLTSDDAGPSWYNKAGKRERLRTSVSPAVSLFNDTV